MVGLGQGHRHVQHHVVLPQKGLVGEVVKGPVEELVGVVKAVCPDLVVLQLRPVAPHHHADKAPGAPGGGGHQTVPRLGGGTGFDAVGVPVEVAPGVPAADQVVGGAQGAGGADIGGGDDDGGRVADGHQLLVLHGLFGNEVHIPGGGVVLGVVDAVGIDEVGVFAAQGLGPGVHLSHKGGHGTGDGLGQDLAGLVGGDHHHAVQQVLHRHDLAGLDARGAAVTGESLQGGGGGGDGLVHVQLSLVNGLQGQKAGHDLGQAGGVELLMLVFGVDDGAGVGVHQQRGLALDVRLLQGGGPGGGPQGYGQDGQQKNR